MSYKQNNNKREREVGGGLRKMALEELVGIEWMGEYDQTMLYTCMKLSNSK